MLDIDELFFFCTFFHDIINHVFEKYLLFRELYLSKMIDVQYLVVQSDDLTLEFFNVVSVRKGKLVNLVVFDGKQLFSLVVLDLSGFSCSHLVISETLKPDDLLFVERLFDDVYLLGLDHIGLVLFLIQNVDFLYELLNLPFIFFELLLSLDYKLIFFQLNGLQSSYLPIYLLLQFFL